MRCVEGTREDEKTARKSPVGQVDEVGETLRALRDVAHEHLLDPIHQSIHHARELLKESHDDWGVLHCSCASRTSSCNFG